MAIRKKYPAELKAKACKLVKEGMTHKEAAKKVKVSSLLIGRWIAAAKKVVPKAKAVKISAPKPEKKVVVGGLLGIEIQAKIDQLAEDLAALNKVKDLLRK